VHLVLKIFFKGAPVDALKAHGVMEVYMHLWVLQPVWTFERRKISCSWL